MSICNVKVLEHLGILLNLYLQKDWWATSRPACLCEEWIFSTLRQDLHGKYLWYMLYGLFIYAHFQKLKQIMKIITVKSSKLSSGFSKAVSNGRSLHSNYNTWIENYTQMIRSGAWLQNIAKIKLLTLPYSNQHTAMHLIFDSTIQV